jgi:integrase
MAGLDRAGGAMSTDWRASAEEYLALRHATGCRLDGHDGLIGQFLDYLADQHVDVIKVEHALAWACRPQGTRTRWHAARLAAVRGFAAHVHARCPRSAELIPAGLLPIHVERAVPYLYTGEQIDALLDAASALAPAVRAQTTATVVALMAAAGLRISEALALDTTDLDIEASTILVTGKYGKKRRLPVHASAVAGLTGYLRISRGLVGSPRDQALFVTLNATRSRAGDVRSAFRSLTRACRLPPGPGNKPPRLHDLRHTFAVHTLIEAHRAGVDVDARITALATYLGHVSPASTYWYYSDSRVIPILAPSRA